MVEGRLVKPSAFTQLTELIKGLFNTASQARKVTLGTSWDYDSTNGYYTQSVLVVGMKATDTPQLSVEISTLSDADSINEEFAKVIDAETYDGGIKFYAKSATTRNLTVVIKPDLSKVTVNNVSSEEAGLDKLQNNINVTNGVHAFRKFTGAGNQVTFTIANSYFNETLLLTVEENVARTAIFTVNYHDGKLSSVFKIFSGSSLSGTENGSISSVEIDETKTKIIVNSRDYSTVTLYTAKNTFE